ncbi:MAG: 23S rRNA (uracil(1939)-C(5))-methyltransferase RlmD [Collinsella sp.]|nr:23S rRNA (uracil(1939)-C(5))-methyltransferase RlmD [Collinsella sp.]MDY5439096.1 23S rRNA (uracil(1939)-C(5))-methyltransferase RlmD [Collinsella sp.]
MAESRAERKARRALIEAAEGSEEKKSSKKSKSSQDTKGKSAKGKAKAKRPSFRRGEDKAPQARSKRSHNESSRSAHKAVDPKSPCSIMKACGGCTALNRPYKKQLATKQAAMDELFAALCEREGITVDPIRGMDVTLGDPGKYPAPRGFRHKAATPFAPGKGGAVRCGFFERGTHRIVAVPECPVEAPGARQILNGIAREAERLHIPAFNEDKHLGLLRYAVVRCGWRTDQIMITLVTAQRDLPHAQEFFEAIAALDPRIVTVAQNINGRPGNAILGEETHIVYGAECMRDQLLGCEFDISPTAFYQTNPQQTELLYQLAIDGMDLHQGDVLMDAYCGSGTIGLCAAKEAQNKGIGIMLLGVERNPAGIADARRNAELNGLTCSAWFMADDATDYILDAADNNERIDVLSIDPPRAGSTPEFLEAACALRPRRITYISCNPVTQERDLHQLLDGGYRLLKITPVDMFPHTDHTETVAVLERR